MNEIEDVNLYIFYLRLSYNMLNANTVFFRSAILCTAPGGSIVYSTSTLSPIQNDGVVSLALKQIWEETNIDMAVCDLSITIQPFKPMMKFAQNTKFGQLVMPQISQNFGPMYISKLKRLNWNSFYSEDFSSKIGLF